ncbi:hypothetical protein PV325_013892 [Microctonus aethiopoides]|nr:hypothetical protein PV325_013892 [Microctonus aethiopoides]KAK0095985.1 hypothetical protein PV326_006863 [Microctonus aethiopoides]
MAARLVDVFEIQHAAPPVSLSYNLRAVRQLQRINLPGERSQEVNGLVEFVNEKTSVPAVTSSLRSFRKTKSQVFERLLASRMLRSCLYITLTSCNITFTRNFTKHYSVNTHVIPDYLVFPTRIS